MKKTPKLFLKLFWSTFQLSAFVVGGGYVIVPLMQKMFVEKYGWISREDMLDITVIGQSAPGAIAINTAILIGFKIAGVLGSIVCVLGAIMPPIVTVTIVSFLYSEFSSNVIVAGFLKGMQGGIAAVILDVLYTMVKPYAKKRDIFSIVLIAAALAVAIFTDINVIFIVLGGIVLGIIIYLLQRNPKIKAFLETKIFKSDKEKPKILEDVILKTEKDKQDGNGDNSTSENIPPDAEEKKTSDNESEKENIEKAGGKK